MSPESTLLSPEMLLSAIVDSSDDAIISKDLRSIITSWNQGAERIFGYTEDEMVGQSVSLLFPPDRLDEENLILSRIARGERVEHFETVRVKKGGAQIDVSLTISPVRDQTGKIIGASKIARDVTEQKRDQKKLTEAHEALQRADRLKTEFLATLSHELRTPLTAILGWIQILKEPASAEELAQGIEVIERNTRLQARLIEDLLDMSRIESGSVNLDVQTVDLSTVVNSALDSVRPAAAGKNIRITSAFAKVDGIVMGDRNRLQQVVWNLLTNAIKFTPRNGRIHVVIKRVNSHVEIIVNDSGQGIAVEFLDCVFDRFRQADASISRKHGGLGLGLSIAKHLTEMHGGSISVQSLGTGLGATFTVNLPLVSAHSSPESLATEKRNAGLDLAASKGDLSGIKILAVEDDADSLLVLQKILRRSGAEVATASSMEEALDRFVEFSPDVVLSDIGMPVHDGYELIARLRLLPRGKSTPAVALTALARSEDRTRALRAGFQMHVAKPVDAQKLIAVVKNLAALQSREP